MGYLEFTYHRETAIDYNRHTCSEYKDKICDSNDVSSFRIPCGAAFSSQLRLTRCYIANSPASSGTVSGKTRSDVPFGDSLV